MQSNNHFLLQRLVKSLSQSCTNARDICPIRKPSLLETLQETREGVLPWHEKVNSSRRTLWADIKILCASLLLPDAHRWGKKEKRPVEDATA
ncbi:hypothetical protein AVEN_6243-1 [Araneus ventricosus]|uniref:Uncharacterized protein n=1 Tax=Araneus ventricosus TaxID=182803 RepID=A0A4Y2GNP2_ARAVE|nr:hypothetical protein AVEN_6243-1 [Araneus ventricosus]